MTQDKFLPTTLQEMEERGWDRLDVILVTADAYCDHPSFGAALLGRLLEAEGYRVGVIAQPDWRREEDFRKLGPPALFFGVAAGNLDSMLSLYTPHLNRRREDKYAPGGLAGMRPKFPTIVYTNKLRSLFKDTPIIIGGIEASLRRLAHYDFWSDKVKRSILFDAKADLLVYGMGERQVLEIARRLKTGECVGRLNYIRGTVINRKDTSFLKDPVVLPSYEEVAKDKKAFLEAFRLYARELNPFTARPVVQKTGDRYCIQLPPALPLLTWEMDRIYGLEFTGRCHPSYAKFGGVPALKTVETSIVSHRGCAASCSFCSLSLHQGRVIQSRSRESLGREARRLAAGKDFKGVISDVGGPTANMYGVSCRVGHRCERPDCLWPEICPNFFIDGQAQLDALEAVRSVRGVRQVNIQSGVRYDLLLRPEAQKYFRQLCRHHVSGQLKVAPEHVSDGLLRLMHKPPFSVYRRFVEAYKKMSKEAGREQYLVQYFITAHPGCGDREAGELAAFVKTMGYTPEQIQDFIPLPMTASSVMYYTGLDPDSGKSLTVVKKKSERMRQRDMVQAGPLPLRRRSR